MAAAGGRIEYSVRPDPAGDEMRRLELAGMHGKPPGLVTRMRRSWFGSVLVGLVVGAVAATVVWAWPNKKIPASTSPSVDLALLSSFFGPQLRARSGGTFGLDRITVHPSTGTRFSDFAQVTYPAYSSSVRASSTADGVTVGGTQLYMTDTAGRSDHAFLRYYLRIPAGFDWVKGGKLPGLYGGTVTSGRKIPDGQNGFSTRYMWRAGGAGEVYAYLPTSKDHGTSLGRGDWVWPTNNWACVEQEVALNDPGRPNGRVNVWLDNRRVLAERDLTFRSTASLKIDGLFFSTFFGGGDKTWATPVEQKMDFADFKISSNRIGC
jgi:hypothetical protein